MLEALKELILLPFTLTWKIVLMFVSGIYKAYVMSLLWVWFIVPLGAPSLNMWHMYGLIVMYGSMFMKLPPKDEEVYSSGEILAVSVVATSLTWLFGYIAFFYM